MNIADIESGLKDLGEKPFSDAGFPFDFLAVFDVPKATITKLKQGSTNEAQADGDILWKKKFFYRKAKKGQAADEVERMLFDPLTKKHSPRFLFATDGIEFFARDLKTEVTADAKLSLLNNSFDFFLPLVGIERYEGVAENPADIKATARLAKLYDAILEANPAWTSATHTHELNIFMTRMLFCFFAEDTSIFEPALFTSTLLTLTKEDGSDTAKTIELIFDVLNLPEHKRDGLPEFVKRFPYVNGGLFAAKVHIPSFSPKARRLLKECGSLVWRDINPDIFGSMIQAVVEPEMRGDMGMHYTSVPNIMKVLHPLFLISLEEELDAAKESEPKLRKLLERIYKIRVFDPACGSGNFLIIAYKELRKLESRIFERLKAVSAQSALQMTGLRLSQFFGIEYTDFATETAKLSLWIAEYQMNEIFKAEFGTAPPSLPLRESGQIVHGNACRVKWENVCPQDDKCETFIVGNPPYLGKAMQSDDQKEDLRICFEGKLPNFKNLDYVTCWMIKAAEYCQKSNSSYAFVTTNSICQGEQVPLLWPLILSMGLEIGFAHLSFKWKNNASDNAAVICVIVGVRPISKSKKILFFDSISKISKNISPYLIDANDDVVIKRSKSISGLPQMDFGSMANDGGNLLLSDGEMQELLNEAPAAKRFIKKLAGSQEFINSIPRFCLWIDGAELEDAKKIAPIARRLEAVRAARESSKRPTTRALANMPHQFGEDRYKKAGAIIVPRVSSERRNYLPVGIVDKDCIISDSALSIYNAPLYVLAILSSRLHILWTAAVGGHLKSDYRYSATLVYNTFPVPQLSKEQLGALDEVALNILTTREKYAGKSLAVLYDPELMPPDLLAAHKLLDATLEKMYVGRDFKDDVERLEHLFKLHSSIVEATNEIRQYAQMSMFSTEE